MGNSCPQSHTGLEMKISDSRAHLFPHTSLQGKPFQDPSWNPGTRRRVLSTFILRPQPEILTWHSTASLRDAGSVLNHTDGMGVPLNRQRELCLRIAPRHTPGWLHTTHEGSQEGRWERASWAACWQFQSKGGLRCISPPSSRMEGKKTHQPWSQSAWVQIPAP